MPPSSSELITAVNHPTRRRILHAYLNDAVDCASAGELAPTVEQRVGQVAYHLKTLARCELLRPVQRDGAHGGGPAYRWKLDVESEWLRLVLDIWVESEPAR